MELIWEGAAAWLVDDLIVIMFVIKPDVKLKNVENTVDLHMKLKKTTKLVCQNYLMHFQDVAIPFRYPKKIQSNH